jgi:hypothetical protein
MHRPIINITHIGGIGNRMFQYMFARALQRHVPNSVVRGYHIPGWDMKCTDISPLPENIASIKGGHEFSLDKIARLMTSNAYAGVDVAVFATRIEYCGSSDIARSMFISKINPDLGFKVPDDCLLISIRGAEIMGGLHADYGPLPFSFYKQVIEESGLKPIFMGQIDDSHYFVELRKRFPNAQFMIGTSPVSDFNTISNSRNVVCSVSTFCWLAAWMSNRTQAIYFPVAGMYNPLQRKDIDLLPLGDERYRFYLSEPSKWKGTPEQIEHLIKGADWARPVTHTELAQAIQGTIA